MLMAYWFSEDDKTDIASLKQISHSSFQRKDLKHLTNFLGLELIPTPLGPFLSQHKYRKDLIDLDWMSDAKLVDTTMHKYRKKLNVKYSKTVGILSLIELFIGHELVVSFISQCLNRRFPIQFNHQSIYVWSISSSLEYNSSHPWVLKRLSTMWDLISQRFVTIAHYLC